MNWQQVIHGDKRWSVDCSDCLEWLRTLPDASVNCCVTSPPYWGLRDYGHDGQLGLEKTPDEYVAKMVAVFAEVRRVLADDGTAWVNLGDSYAGSWGNYVAPGSTSAKALDKRRKDRYGTFRPAGSDRNGKLGFKPKDLIGIPWAVAFALRQPYVDWQIKTEAMRAWTAGIVDGEGCITILKTKSSHSESLSFPPVVQVRMSDREALDRLVEVVGSRIGKAQMPPSHLAAKQRENWQWKIVSAQAAKVIAEIYPYLTVKRKQAIVAWNHQQFRSKRGNQERTREDLEREELCKRIINSLNQRESVDIPSWMKEPAVVETPGWYLRQDLIWSKPNPMPESVTDRCTKAHEYVFLLSKSKRYYYNAEAIQEPLAASSVDRLRQNVESQNGSYRVPGKTNGPMKAVGGKKRPFGQCGGNRHGDEGREFQDKDNRNRRSVWTIATQPYPQAHFATYPPALVKPCILAGCPAGGIVIDPFCGSGTTLQVAVDLGCRGIGCELNPEYIRLIENRMSGVTAGMFP